MAIKGIIVSGNTDKVYIRKSSSQEIELGELLISENKNQNSSEKILLQVVDLLYSSQLSQQNLELISGFSLEENEDLFFYDKNLKNYIIAIAKPLVLIKEVNGKPKIEVCKILPDFLSNVRGIEENDIEFTQENKLYMGNLRTGSKILDKKVYVDGKKVLSHHILISAQTGKGKSNLIKNIIYESRDINYASFVIFDPHDEYYRNSIKSDKINYYSINPLPNTSKLSFSLSLLKPGHLFDIENFSDPQKQLMNIYYSAYNHDWIEAILKDKPVSVELNEAVVNAIKRRIVSSLEISLVNGKIISKSVFSVQGSQNILKSMISQLENSHVVIDTSRLSDKIEHLISMMIGREIFNYKKNVENSVLKNKIISFIIEEAPRVLNDETNIFSTIAREGRKFGIGLIAITQLPSLIPRQILANLNTKIILGTEMSIERRALIDSSAQDLSDFSKSIAALNVGEAIVTTTFTSFALPIKTRNFDDVIKEESKTKKEKYNLNLSI